MTGADRQESGEFAQEEITEVCLFPSAPHRELGGARQLPPSLGSSDKESLSLERRGWGPVWKRWGSPGWKEKRKSPLPRDSLFQIKGHLEDLDLATLLGSSSSSLTTIFDMYLFIVCMYVCMVSCTHISALQDSQKTKRGQLSLLFLPCESLELNSGSLGLAAATFIQETSGCP